MGNDSENNVENPVLSDKFKKNIDDLKERIRKEHMKGSADSDSETTQEFVRVKRGRKMHEVRDKMENIGSNVDAKTLTDKFKTLDSSKAAGILADAESEEKKSIRKRFSYSRLYKYVFKDAFGHYAGVFYSPKSRRYLTKLLDIQVNCIYDVSRADGSVWKVIGRVEDEQFYYVYHHKMLGYVHCVGIANAIVLARALCELNGYTLSHIMFVNVEVKRDGRKR